MYDPEEVRQKVIRWAYVGLDETRATDDDGLPIMYREIATDPFIEPDYSDTGTAAVVADAILRCPDLAVIPIEEHAALCGEIERLQALLYEASIYT